MTTASTAAPSGADVAAGTSTGTQGANDATSPSATPAQAEKPKSWPTRMAERLGLKRAEAEKAAKAAQQPADDKSANGVKDAQVPGGNDDKSKDKPEETDDDGVVPKKAFKERIGKLNERLRESEQRNTAKDLDINRYKAAVELMAAEVQRITDAWKSGAAFDENLETIRQHELANTARTRAGDLQKQHTDTLSELTAKAEQAEVNRQVNEEIAAALAAHPIVAKTAKAELGRRLRLKENLGKDATTVAAEIEAEMLELAKPKLVSSKPAAPSTVKPAGGGTGGHRRPNNAKSMEATLAARRQASTS